MYIVMITADESRTKSIIEKNLKITAVAKTIPVLFHTFAVEDKPLSLTSFGAAVDKLTAVSEENMEMKKIIDDIRSYFMLKHQHEQMAKRLDSMSKQILDEINHPERKNYRKNRSVDYDDDE